MMGVSRLLHDKAGSLAVWSGIQLSEFTCDHIAQPAAENFPWTGGRPATP